MPEDSRSRGEAPLRPQNWTDIPSSSSGLRPLALSLSLVFCFLLEVLK